MKIFLFDFDGVVIDTLPIAVSTYNSLLRKYNIPHQFTNSSFLDLFNNNFHQGLASIVSSDICEHCQFLS
jgi:phosphoglycolate phosphatase-like HAD superfamily hydrolase